MAEWKNILIVDDICDTGKTLEAVKAKIRSYGPTAEGGIAPFKFRTACLLWKPDSCETPPTWWVKEADESTWTVFPHEFVGVSLKEKLIAEKKEQ